MSRYNHGNFSYVIDSSFQPFSMQEMLVPFTAYKDAYEKAEEAYTDLNQKADTFSYLAEVAKTNPNSKAAQIYQGYADELHKQAADLATNGFSMSNRRALTNLKRRYQGEIGQLAEARSRLDKEIELRRQLGLKDPSMLYADDNLDLDKYLGQNTPNLYGISGDELRKEGALYAQAASSRIYGNTQISDLNKYFQEQLQTQGYSPEIIAAWRQNLESIPEFRQAVDDIMAARGVTDNLSGRNLEMARQSIINGIMEGAIYKEARSVQQNPGVLTAAQEAADARARESTALSALQSGYVKENGKWIFKPEILKERAEAMGMAGYNPAEWEIGPDGKPRKKTKTNTAAGTTPDEKKSTKKGEALLKLKKADLAHNEGFDVSFGDHRHHYDYIGALSSHGGKWYHGPLGEDNPGHNGLVGWGMFSSSNVENKWGNFSAEGSDSSSMRVLSSDELNSVLQNEDFNRAFNERVDAYLKERGIEPGSAEEGALDIQLIEVPNEKDSSKKGYLIAIH